MDQEHKHEADASCSIFLEHVRPAGSSTPLPSIQDTEGAPQNFRHGLGDENPQLLTAAPDVGSTSKASAQSSWQEPRAEEQESRVAPQQHGGSLPRHASTSQQVASALAASRAQWQQTEDVSPASSSVHTHSPEQEQCIQQLRDRVSGPHRVCNSKTAVQIVAVLSR